MTSTKDRRAAIICCHCADGAPILRALRGEPMAEEDSGWQFLCGASGHGEAENAKIWAVEEVLSEEPSLRAHVKMPAGTILTRPDREHAWQVSKD